ncbi:MAG: right-handed parallel beta-helix repeat-containing protein, partial [Pseudomonadota bacterium]
DDVMADVRWTRPPVAPSADVALAKGPKATLGWIDSRLALAPIHHVYGADGAGPIRSAMGDYGTEAVLITGGVATLKQLRDGLTNRQWRYDLAEDRHTLRVPLVVGEDATLRLTDGEYLALSRKDGAFILGLGKLEIVGARVHGTEEESPRHHRFRPFVTALGGAYIADAWFADLGYGFSVKYSGLSLISHPTFGQTERTVVRNSRFDRLVTLSVVGIASPEIEGNRFFSMARNALLVSRSANARVSGNLFSGPSPTNAVRVLHGSDGARLTGNVVLEGARAGLLVSDGSDDARMRGNLIWRRDGGGLKLSGVRCGVVERNLVLDDKQKGVEVRDSRDAVVRDNHIIGNRNAGVWLSAMAPDAVTVVEDNVIRENGSGLATAQGGEVALNGNDLTDQYPRFLDGELTHQFRALMGNLNGGTPLVMSALGTREATVAHPANCGRG